MVAIFILTISLSLVYAEEFGYNNPSLPQLIEELFGGNPSSFYMPNNKSVFGNFSFNGGFLDGGCTIRDGAILCQEGFFVNISSLNITQLNLTILNNLTIDGNVSADFFLGDFIGTHFGNSSIWSRAGTNTFLTNSGDFVGIGTTDPMGKLHVQEGSSGVAAAGNADQLVVENDGAGGISILTPDASNAQIFFGTPSDTSGVRLIWNHNNDLFQLGSSNPSSETAIMSGSFVEAIRIDSSQNVGIGTSTPQNLLNVDGDVNITGNLTVDETTLFVDSTNNRVGINTTTPQDTLNVVGDVNVTEDIFSNGFQVISYQRTVNIKNVTMTAVI